MVATGDLTTGGTIQTVQGIRNVITENSAGGFPLTKIETKLNDYNKSMGFDQEDLERWFSGGKTSNRVLRVVLSLLYFPDIANENYKYELDHIFPKSKLSEEYLIDEANFSREKAKKVNESGDMLANLQLLRKGENQKKSDESPSEWLPTRTSGYLQRHHIPEDENLFKLENVDKFFERRKSLMISKLTDNVPDRNNASPSSI